MTTPSERVQFPEVPVARDKVLGAAGHGALEKLVVVGISPHDRQTPPDTDGLHEGEQFLLDQHPDLLIAELELGVCQNPQILLKDVSRNEDRDAVGLPEGNEARRSPRKEQGGDRRVGAQDDPDYLRRLRAQRIAPSTSFSARPRCRIFSRTAFSLSPGVLITTGLKTTSPSLRDTSK